MTLTIFYYKHSLIYPAAIFLIFKKTFCYSILRTHTPFGINILNYNDRLLTSTRFVEPSSFSMFLKRLFNINFTAVLLANNCRMY